MRIWYYRNPYISYFRAGQEYINCLHALGHELVDGPQEADLAVLHDEPTNYPLLMAQMGENRPHRVVGYAVWETEKLSPAFAPGLALVDEVWTCSEFSRAALAQACAEVHLLPHVVRRQALSNADLRAARERFCAGPRDFVFFSVVDFLNPRKNVETLLAAYSSMRARIEDAQGGRARSGGKILLALKQYRVNCELPGLPGLINIDGNLDDKEMAALYAACDCYVSAHRSEAWGLSLSEAMSYGRPVIATGYSGNMQYMNKDNSIPVPYSLVPVSAVMAERFPIFTTDMLWAEISLPDLIQAMLREVADRNDAQLRANAATIAEVYGPTAITGVLRRLIDRIYSF